MLSQLARDAANVQQASRELVAIVRNKFIELEHKVVRAKSLELYCQREEARAEPAKFGLGTESVYDVNVRSARSVAITTVPDEATRAINAMMPKLEEFFLYPLEIKPSKISYYQPGDFFKRHLDTVISPDHIGTLLLGTTSEYTGGELKVDKCSYSESAGGNEDLVVAHKLNQSNHIAFTTDCWHEVAPVTSGKRIVLQFDVFIKHGTTAAVAKDEDSTSTDDSDSSSSDFDSDDSNLQPPLKSGQKRDRNCVDPTDVNALALTKYCKELLQYGQNCAIFASHLYPVRFCNRLKGIDKHIADKVLSLDPEMRCLCVPVIVKSEADEYAARRAVCVGKEHSTLFKDAYIINDCKYAYEFVTSFCYELNPVGNSPAEGDGSFLYSASVLLFGRNLEGEHAALEYKRNKTLDMDDLSPTSPRKKLCTEANHSLAPVDTETTKETADDYKKLLAALESENFTSIREAAAVVFEDLGANELESDAALIKSLAKRMCHNKHIASLFKSIFRIFNECRYLLCEKFDEDVDLDLVCYWGQRIKLKSNNEYVLNMDKIPHTNKD